ncbi:hypothetical protein BST81_25895 [Leptolyngbya sp. 'hensonii']|uniref:hypothetical protein n=1 Tax=Leptolyngbya sp. 'hensonii' TaxID=1922337 RepID=UPI0009501216|nr:hypothetical protein [Leptolyngbya sp. 'hensonii']OLP15496.1 hypothetical protein BST81_25895 [Leptolyngbya sp. 'hensonii']
MEGQSVPVSVKVFGILNTIFGSFGVVTSPFTLLAMRRTVMVYERFDAGPLVLGWIRLSLLISPIIAGVLLATGIGLLMKKAWGRSAAVILAYISIGISIFNIILILSVFAKGLGGSESAAAVGGIIGGIIGGTIGLIYPILTAIFLTRPDVKAALERRSQG